MPVGASGWVAATGAEVTPAAANTAKTFLNVIAAANRTLKVTELGIAFVGASAVAKPVLVELCHSTQAGAGTPGAAVTPISTKGAGEQNTVQATAQKGYTAEPTVLTVIREWLVHPQAGLIFQFPLGREPETGPNDGLALRVTFITGETVVNGRAYIEFEE